MRGRTLAGVVVAVVASVLAAPAADALTASDPNESQIVDGLDISGVKGTEEKAPGAGKEFVFRIELYKRVGWVLDSSSPSFLILSVPSPKESKRGTTRRPWPSGAEGGHAAFSRSRGPGSLASAVCGRGPTTSS